MDSKDVVNNFISSQIYTNHQGLTQAENVDKSLKKVVDNLYAGKQETDAQLATIGSKVGDVENIDFAIADEKGNSPLQVADGYIKTKNFDSKKATQVDDIEEDYPFAMADNNGHIAWAIDAEGNLIAKGFNSKTAGGASKTIVLNGDEICDYYAINSSGNHVLADGFGCSRYIDCADCLSFSVKMSKGNSNYGLAFYNANKQFISFVANNSGANGVETRTINVPANAKYFRTTFWNFANQSTYGEFECTITYAGVLSADGKRPYQSGNIYFSQRVNQAYHDWQKTDAENELAVNNKVTTGVLLLPSTYTKEGKKTKLIMYCHGYSHYVYYGKWGSTDNFQTQKQHWADMGFAVFDCNGSRDTNRQAQGANNFATAPQNVNAYRKCYEYIVNNYNIDPDIYVVAGSMGGQVGMQYLYTHGYHVRACALLSAHVYSRTWWNTCAVIGDVFGESGTINATAIDGENKEKYVGHIPEDRYVTIADEKYNFEFPCPVKALWGSLENDSESYSNNFIFHMKELIAILRKSGKEATCRMITGLDHSAVVSGANMVVDTEVANWFNQH